MARKNDEMDSASHKKEKPFSTVAKNDAVYYNSCQSTYLDSDDNVSIETKVSLWELSKQEILEADKYTECLAGVARPV